jgi:putative hydrolase of the HAD superfamily
VDREINVAPPCVLLFDIGGVLVENATFQELARLLPPPVDISALPDRWLDSAAVQRFERGLITEEEFAAGFVDEWALEIEPARFLAAFATWPRGPYPGALALLERLRGRFTIAVLSNCNSLHWRRLADVINHADRAFSSHQLGLVKPDAAIFERVVQALDCAPDRIGFFDDSLRNVNAARAAGLLAHHTVGFEALRDTITAQGLLA